MKVSVIVPVYNAEDFLPECIDSILKQKFTDFELILVDDGSTDNSGSICDEYAKNDSRVKVFHEKNGGVSFARNLGLKHATGEWVSFVDSDDFINSNTFKELATYLFNQYDLISFGFRGLSTKGEIMYQISPEEGSTTTMRNYYSLYKRKPNSACAHIIRREILVRNQIKFNQSLKNNEDILFINQVIANSHNYLLINKVFYNQILTPNSASRRSLNINMVLDRLRMIDELFIFGTSLNTKRRKLLFRLANDFLKGFFINISNLTIKNEIHEGKSHYKLFYKKNYRKLRSLYAHIANYSFDFIIFILKVKNKIK